jgi:hypothetical protein
VAENKKGRFENCGLGLILGADFTAFRDNAASL